MPIALRRILFPRFARRPIRRWARQPFGRLVGHFLARIVRGGQDPTAEFELGIGGLLGLLAAPGIFNCFLLFDKYSTFLNWYRGGGRLLRQDYLLTSMPDKYLFIAVAMAVAGFVAVLKWDQLLPDSQDYLNLAPLPVRPRNILLANAMAISIAIVVVAIDVSAVPAVLFPGIRDGGGRSAVLLLSAVRGGACDFRDAGQPIFDLRGLRHSWADSPRSCRGKPSARAPPGCAALMLLAYIALLLTGFGGATLVRALQHSPDSLLRFLPSLWFLGLYQSLQHRPIAVLPSHLALLGRQR